MPDKLRLRIHAFLAYSDCVFYAIVDLIQLFFCRDCATHKRFDPSGLPELGAGQ